MRRFAPLCDGNSRTAGNIDSGPRDSTLKKPGVTRLSLSNTCVGSFLQTSGYIVICGRCKLHYDRKLKIYCLLSTLAPYPARFDSPSCGMQDSVSGLTGWLSSLQLTRVTLIFYMS